MRASGIAHEIECVVKYTLNGCDSAIQGNDRFQAMSDLTAARNKLLLLASQVRKLAGTEEKAAAEL
jgi:hypothetical protein